MRCTFVPCYSSLALFSSFLCTGKQQSGELVSPSPEQHTGANHHPDGRRSAGTIDNNDKRKEKEKEPCIIFECSFLLSIINEHFPRRQVWKSRPPSTHLPGHFHSLMNSRSLSQHWKCRAEAQTLLSLLPTSFRFLCLSLLANVHPASPS